MKRRIEAIEAHNNRGMGAGRRAAAGRPRCGVYLYRRRKERRRGRGKFSSRLAMNMDPARGRRQTATQPADLAWKSGRRGVVHYTEL